jgi:uncharacterized membrane protein
MKNLNKSSKNTSAQRISYPKILVFGSLVGLIASFWQAAERVQMLKFPGEALSCNLNPVVDCGAVLGNKLSAVFGPPNAFIGMVVFSMLFAFGLQRLSGGTWTSFTAKFVAAFSKIIMLFSLWFFYISLYSIGKVCIFCLFIWTVSMPIGIYGVKDYLENSKNPPDYQIKIRDFLSKHHFTLLVVVYATLVSLFFLKFSDYYFG